MATVWGIEPNDTPKTATGPYFISDYGKGERRWNFAGGIQSIPTEFGAVDPYDPVDYFAFSHLPGLKKVSWNMSFLMDNPFNFEEPAKQFGGRYDLTIAPSGAFKGEYVSVNVRIGFANYMDEWYEYNQTWREIEGALDSKWQELHDDDKDTTMVDRAMDVMDDISALLEQIPGSNSKQLDQIEGELGAFLVNSNYEDADVIHSLVVEIIEMARGWDKLHYYLGASEEEVFLKELKERTTWKVQGNDLGYVAFSGGVTLYNDFADIEFVEGFLSSNWYLEVQSEKRPKKGREAFDDEPDADHIGLAQAFDPSSDMLI